MKKEDSGCPSTRDQQHGVAMVAEELSGCFLAGQWRLFSLWRNSVSQRSLKQICYLFNMLFKRIYLIYLLFNCYMLSV